MKDICAECGDRKILNDSGVCKNRHGCEHRQYQHREAVARLTAEMDRQRQVQKSIRFVENYSQRPDNGYAPPGGSSLLHFWMNNHPSQTNQWVDEWLHGPDEDED